MSINVETSRSSLEAFLRERRHLRPDKTKRLMIQRKGKEWRIVYERASRWKRFWAMLGFSNRANLRKVLEFCKKNVQIIKPLTNDQIGELNKRIHLCAKRQFFFNFHKVKKDFKFASRSEPTISEPVRKVTPPESPLQPPEPLPSQTQEEDGVRPHDDGGTEEVPTPEQDASAQSEVLGEASERDTDQPLESSPPSPVLQGEPEPVPERVSSPEPTVEATTTKEPDAPTEVSLVDEKAVKQRNQREHVCREILETEKNFLKLKKKNLELLKKQEVLEFFDKKGVKKERINEAIDFLEKTIESTVAFIKAMGNPEEQDVEKRTARVIKAYLGKKFSRYYISNTKNLGYRTKKWAEIETELNDSDKRILGRLTNNSSLFNETFLFYTNVVQRIPRHHLILKELGKGIPESHPSYHNFREALSRLEQYCNRLNERTTHSDVFENKK